MSAPERRTPVEVLRRTAAARAAATSVSQVAREVGLTPRGLQKFLNGSDPYSATRQKLERWYVRDVAREGSGVDAATAMAALAVLTHDLPPDGREVVMQEAVAWWRAVYEKAGVPVPVWVRGLSSDSLRREGQ